MRRFSLQHILTPSAIAKLLLLCSLLAVGCADAIAQTGISGVVKDSKGDPLPYVTIYCRSAKTGTNTNMNGEFKINLPPGSYELSFQSIDYQQKQQTVLVQTGYTSINVTLKEQVYALKEVAVKSSSQNPAVYIMRKAIAAAPYYRRQVLAYQANVYIKGSGTLEKVPFMFRKLLKDNNLEQGKTYVSESLTELSFSQPETYREHVISVKTSLPATDGPEPMMMARGSLYSTSSHHIISPLSPQAFSVYEYKLLGSFFENGREVNKIQLIPKRKGKDLYEGYMYIVEGLWCLHSCVLTNHNGSVDATIKTSFKEQPGYPYVWMPVTYDISFTGSYFGVGGKFRYLASLSNYKIRLNPNVDHSWAQQQKIKTGSNPDDDQPTPAPAALPQKEKTRNQKQIEVLLAKENLSKMEMLKLASKMKRESERQTQQLRSVNDSSDMIIDSNATTKDSAFWNANRPVPLLKEEVQSYALTDTIPMFNRRDSSQRKPFYVSTLLTGDSVNLRNRKHYFVYTGLLFNTNVNTVDGWHVEARLSAGNFRSNAWRYDQYVKVPFERSALLTTGKLSYCYSPLHFGNVYLQAGTYTRDYNEQGITRLVNSLQLLIYQNNFMKLYQQDFVKAAVQYEPVNGLIVDANMSFANRYPLNNISRYEKKEGKKGIEINKPFNFLTGNGMYVDMPVHRSVNYELAVAYQFFQEYRIHNNTKRYMRNEWPMLKMQVRGGLPGMLNSKSDFTHISLGVAQDVYLQHWVNLKYQVNAGRFVNNTSVFFPDYQHFAGNQAYTFNGSAFNRFQDLSYYGYSTNNRYFQAFTQLDFKRIILKRLPYLNLTRMHEQLFVNMLRVQGLPNYLETGYRLSDIFSIFNISVYARFMDGNYKGMGIRGAIRLPI